MHGTTVSESTYDGIHTIIIHVQIPQKTLGMMPPASTIGTEFVEENFDEPGSQEKEPFPSYEEPACQLEDPTLHQGERVSQPKEVKFPHAGPDTVQKEPSKDHGEELTNSHDKALTNGIDKPLTNGHMERSLYKPDSQPLPSRFDLKCHPRVREVCAELDEFFGTYWPWENEAARREFLDSDTNEWGCWAMPLLRDDRVVDTVRVNTLLFLLDDVAENMSLSDGKAFYHRLVQLAKGKELPDRANPYEWITYDTFAGMRAVDEYLTNAVLQDAILCVEAQVDEARNSCTSMGDLLRQRYKEGGVRFVAACTRYGSALKVTDAALDSIKDIEISYSRLGIIVNDIHSFEKEARAYSKARMEGAKILNMVQMQALDTGTSYEAAKRVLWVLCREWELQHLELVRAREKQMDRDGLEGPGERDEDLRVYLKALEYVLSGNEKWSEYTQRYHGKEEGVMAKTLDFDP